MHELAITQSIVDMVEERFVGERVGRVVVEVGRLAGVVPEAMTFCWEACIAGTVAEGARLEVRSVDGRARCEACGAEFAVDAPFGVCACGSRDVALVRGQELLVKEVEVL
jgi:hydrogenase nickel incorporation protein HypA/HybF